MRAIKAVMAAGTALAVGAAAVWVLWPEPVLVDLLAVQTAPMEVTVATEGVTRVRETSTLFLTPPPPPPHPPRPPRARARGGGGGGGGARGEKKGRAPPPPPPPPPPLRPPRGGGAEARPC